MEALILDDERASAESLFLLLQRYCPEVNVIALETDVAEALVKMRELKPKLFFLDINLSNFSGFDFLRSVAYPHGVIFTTAFEEYALKAIKSDAMIDFLLKPISPEELVNAVSKARAKLPAEPIISSPSITPNLLKKIAVPVSEGIVFLDLSRLIRFEAQGSYTKVVQDNSPNLLISKNLAALEAMTQNLGFVRVHRSHLVNSARIEKFFKGEGGELLLSNGDRVPVARDRRDDFLDHVR